MLECHQADSVPLDIARLCSIFLCTCITPARVHYSAYLHTQSTFESTQVLVQAGQGILRDLGSVQGIETSAWPEGRPATNSVNLVKSLDSVAGASTHEQTLPFKALHGCFMSDSKI